MRILPVNFNNHIFNSQTRKDLRINSFSPNYVSDSFTKSEAVSFQANTSAGNPLKKLKGLKCPYFGVEMISGADIARIEKRLDKCFNVKDAVKVLSKYTKYMQETEKKMYKRFAEMAKTAPDKTLPECLQLWYDEAIIKLKLEEFNVLDDVDKISLKLSPENALAVHAKTTRCRQIILANDKTDTFKRKILLTSLDDIKPKNSGNEPAIFEKLKDRAVYLPTSGTSENAFIVKYADRTQQEVAKRILRPSIATIEHIQPNSLDGENAIGNFMLASAGANSMRSNMPLPKFIEMFPSVPKKCQAYIDQIIELIHKGQLKGNETYPYKIRTKLAQESRGKISLDLSKYKYSAEQAAKAERDFYTKQRLKASYKRSSKPV